MVQSDSGCDPDPPGNQKGNKDTSQSSCKPNKIITSSLLTTGFDTVALEHLEGHTLPSQINSPRCHKGRVTVRQKACSPGTLDDDESKQSDQAASPACSDADASGSDYDDAVLQNHACCDTDANSGIKFSQRSKTMRFREEGQGVLDQKQSILGSPSQSLVRSQILAPTSAAVFSRAGPSRHVLRTVECSAESQAIDLIESRASSTRPGEVVQKSTHTLRLTEPLPVRVDSVSCFKRKKAHSPASADRKRKLSISRKRPILEQATSTAKTDYDQPELRSEKTANGATGSESSQSVSTARESSLYNVAEKKTRFVLDDRRQVYPAPGTRSSTLRHDGPSEDDSFPRSERHVPHKLSSSIHEQNEMSCPDLSRTLTRRQSDKSRRLSPRVSVKHGERSPLYLPGGVVSHHTEGSGPSIDTRISLLSSGSADSSSSQRHTLLSDGRSRFPADWQAPRFDLLDPSCLVSSLRDRTVWTFWDCYAPVGTRDQDIVFISKDDMAFPCAAWNPSIFSAVLKDIIRNPATHIKAVLERSSEENRMLLGCVPVPCVRIDEDWQCTNFLLSFVHPIPSLYLPDRVIAEKVLDLGIRYQVDRAVTAARHRLDELDRRSDAGDSPSTGHVD